MLKGWRTIILNILGAVVPALSLTELIAILPPEWVPYWMLGLAVANMVLRAFTTTPIGQRA